MAESPAPSLRERKRARTRAALIEAGSRLFEERGYDQTTVADIAAEVEIGTRTFFAYFETKEQLLFAEADGRVGAALHAIRTRDAGETPAGVLLRALGDATLDGEMLSPVARLRLRLTREIPAVQARVLATQIQAQRDIAGALVGAYPELDAVWANALVGAFIGATSAALDALFAGPDEAEAPIADRSRLVAAVAAALGEGRRRLAISGTRKL